MGEISMKRSITPLFVVVLLLFTPELPAQDRAKNVVLFLGDAGGIPTVNAASIYGYSKPHQLFLQKMPHIALSETSSASQWVTDSAAGMTAIVTGYKTHNGVISQSDTAVRRVKDGAPLKTILEYAEEQGLSTGVVSNSSAASATPAACYAHVNDRAKEGEIFAQILEPRFGDGIDLVLGAGQLRILDQMRKLGLDPEVAIKAKGYAFGKSLESVPSDAKRIVVLFDSGNFDLGAATQRAVDILSRNPKGFFLMVESDVHTDNVVRGLERVVTFDRIIQQTAERMKSDTLILFTADHSFDLRIHSGKKKEPLFTPSEKATPTDDVSSIRFANVRRDDDHTGEEVLVAAQGPGAQRVRGFLSNTDLFHIMMGAYGWTVTGAK
jgi:alkaline phosphatase